MTKPDAGLQTPDYKVQKRLHIAQVTPFAWEADHVTNNYVRLLSAELSERGHQVTILAPSASQSLVRTARRRISAARDDLTQVQGQPGRPLLLPVGEVMDFPPTRRSPSSLPINVTRTVEQLLTLDPYDIVHVHDPFIPSLGSAALRHSYALNVGSFHAPTERLLATQVVRRMQELFFGRLDARTVSYQATADLLRNYFPGRYEQILPGVAWDTGLHRRDRGENEPLQIAFCCLEDRSALRLFIRALRKLPLELAWQVRIFAVGEAPPINLRATVRDRVEVVIAEDSNGLGGRCAEGIAAADLAVFASSGSLPTPELLLSALAHGVVPVAARLPTYAELLGEGDRGLLFEAGDADTLAAQLERLLRKPELRSSLRERAQAIAELARWTRVGDEVERIYERLEARRHDTSVPAKLRQKLRRRPLIDVDLHMHTDHSYDCATPVDALLRQAKAVGLGAIAVTDHNEIAGAFEAAERAEGIKVIVAEEVKTAQQGEVIGLFLKEKIPRGMNLAETIAAIKAQGGLVYIPHPFDRMHSVPDYEHLLDVIADIDGIEVYNARVAMQQFNQEAVRFARKYRLPAGAGSDAHVLQGLGSARIRMRDFNGPEEFLAALKEADIIHKPRSLFYVQALKFLQTKGLSRKG